MEKCDICAFTVTLQQVTIVQEKHMGGHASGCHPTVNYFQLHCNSILLAIYMQLYIMSYYKCVLTLIRLFCHVLKLK